MAVAPVLTQHGRRLPEHIQRILRPGQRGVRRRQDPAGEVGRLRRLPAQPGRLRDVDVTEEVAQRGAGPGRAGGEGLRRIGQLPHRRQGTLDHRAGEAVERGIHRSRTDRAEGCAASGEVAAPETAQADLLERGPCLRGEVGDRMQRFEQGPHRPRGPRGIPVEAHSEHSSPVRRWRSGEQGRPVPPHALTVPMGTPAAEAAGRRGRDGRSRTRGERGTRCVGRTS